MKLAWYWHWLDTPGWTCTVLHGLSALKSVNYMLITAEAGLATCREKACHVYLPDRTQVDLPAEARVSNGCN